MAGDWIKMRGNLWDDPRVSRLCDLTNQSEATVIGGLYWLWAAADQHTESGVMLGLSASSINRKTGIKKFAEALIEIGWIADHPEGIRIVRFEEHNGVSAKRRCTDAQRKANWRVMSASEADKSRTEGGHAEDEKRRISELEKEKRREEKKEETHTDESPPVATKAGAVCVLLKSKGIGIVNPGNQKLISLLEAGAHIGAFDAAADIAKAKGKDFAYILGIVEKEMAQQANLVGQELATKAHPTQVDF